LPTTGLCAAQVAISDLTHPGTGVPSFTASPTGPADGMAALCGGNVSARTTDGNTPKYAEPSLAVRSNFYVYAASSQDEGADNIRYRSSAPEYAPHRPSCSGYHSYAWQYHSPSGTAIGNDNGIDIDEYKGTKDVLW